jgi:hypothetical protein
VYLWGYLALPIYLNFPGSSCGGLFLGASSLFSRSKWQRRIGNLHRLDLQNKNRKKEFPIPAPASSRGRRRSLLSPQPWVTLSSHSPTSVSLQPSHAAVTSSLPPKAQSSPTACAVTRSLTNTVGMAVVGRLIMADPCCAFTTELRPGIGYRRCSDAAAPLSLLLPLPGMSCSFLFIPCRFLLFCVYLCELLPSTCLMLCS